MDDVVMAGEDDGARLRMKKDEWHLEMTQGLHPSA